MAKVKEQFAYYNLRTIYKKMNEKRSLLLCIDALDMVTEHGEPNPCMKFQMSNLDISKETGQRADICSFFIPAARFLLLTHNVLSGVYSRQKKEALKRGSTQNHYFEQYGGGFKNNMIVSRSLSLVDGLGQAAFAFVGTEGAGVNTKNGGFSPKTGEKPTFSCFVNMPDDELKELCLIGKAYLDSYIQIELSRRLPFIRNQREEYTRKHLK